MRLPHPRTVFARRGSLSTGCLGALIVVVLLALIAGVTLMSTYNGLASRKQVVGAKWAAIDSQYKRRFDLIPQLVETVKGSAKYERGTLQAVVDARASVGKVQLPAEALDDPARMRQYIEAQGQLTGALSRLLVVAEQYPDLKATQGFRALQDQIEGTENRIAVARHDYIEAVRGYDTKVVTFPGNVLARWFGFQELPQLEAAAPAERAVPKIEFDLGDQKK